MAERHKYSVDDLKIAVQNSRSIAQVLGKLGIVPAGGNYQTVKRRINKYDIDTSHFSGQSWNKGKTVGPKRPLIFYLKKNSIVQSFRLKKRLIAEKIFAHKCCNCSKKTWLNKKIPLELHHIDGNHNNNELSNLTLLCPNCHALTYNYRGKNK
jgi:5-methylcytosine-specific restriction endonuclease McrA